ncbi:MAG: hypothetical protein K2X71_29070 [Methylobacterium sp.]|uniref:hypothetical protein n=1 Tax=Methylobacterium sp. TaxID=409 RepID=UPI00258A88D4|nr:hypothetical protein [Methylobacterium sp.]MBY0300043.1 hypothetical protein [Methylobacterium sp.]
MRDRPRQERLTVLHAQREEQRLEALDIGKGSRILCACGIGEIVGRPWASADRLTSDGSRDQIFTLLGRQSSEGIQFRALVERGAGDTVEQIGAELLTAGRSSPYGSVSAPRGGRGSGSKGQFVRRCALPRFTPSYTTLRLRVQHLIDGFPGRDVRGILSGPDLGSFPYDRSNFGWWMPLRIP